MNLITTKLMQISLTQADSLLFKVKYWLSLSAKNLQNKYLIIFLYQYEFFVKINPELTALMQLCQNAIYSRKLEDRLCESNKNKIYKRKACSLYNTQAGMFTYKQCMGSHFAQKSLIILLVLRTKHIDFV